MNAAVSSPPLPARDRLLRTAHDLFYRDGIRATGIDRVIAEAGVTKVTFYRHFASKDLLVRAFLDYRHLLWMGWFIDSLGRHDAESRGLSALPDALEEWFSSPVFRGCAFINSSAETAGDLVDTHAVGAAHKHEMVEVISWLGSPELAGVIGLMVDGAIVRAQMGESGSAVSDLRIALSLLESEKKGRQSMAARSFGPSISA